MSGIQPITMLVHEAYSTARPIDLAFPSYVAGLAQDVQEALKPLRVTEVIVKVEPAASLPHSDQTGPGYTPLDYLIGPLLRHVPSELHGDAIRIAHEKYKKVKGNEHPDRHTLDLVA